MKILYEQTLVKTTELEISDEEAALLKGYSEERDALQQEVIARGLEKAENDPVEWVGTSCTTESGEELFEL